MGQHHGDGFFTNLSMDGAFYGTSKVFPALECGVLRLESLKKYFLRLLTQAIPSGVLLGG